MRLLITCRRRPCLPPAWVWDETQQLSNKSDLWGQERSLMIFPLPARGFRRHTAALSATHISWLRWDYFAHSADRQSLLPLPFLRLSLLAVCRSIYLVPKTFKHGGATPRSYLQVHSFLNFLYLFFFPPQSCQRWDDSVQLGVVFFLLQ